MIITSNRPIFGHASRFFSKTKRSELRTVTFVCANLHRHVRIVPIGWGRWPPSSEPPSILQPAIPKRFSSDCDAPSAQKRLFSRNNTRRRTKNYNCIRSRTKGTVFKFRRWNEVRYFINWELGFSDSNSELRCLFYSFTTFHVHVNDVVYNNDIKCRWYFVDDLLLNWSMMG